MSVFARVTYPRTANIFGGRYLSTPSERVFKTRHFQKPRGRFWASTHLRRARINARKARCDMRFWWLGQSTLSLIESPSRPARGSEIPCNRIGTASTTACCRYRDTVQKGHRAVNKQHIRDKVETLAKRRFYSLLRSSRGLVLACQARQRHAGFGRRQTSAKKCRKKVHHRQGEGAAGAWGRGTKHKEFLDRAEPSLHPRIHPRFEMYICVIGRLPLVGVNLGLLADQVGETAAHSPDGGQRVLHLHTASTRKQARAKAVGGRDRGACECPRKIAAGGVLAFCRSPPLRVINKRLASGSCPTNANLSLDAMKSSKAPTSLRAPQTEPTQDRRQATIQTPTPALRLVIDLSPILCGYSLLPR